MRKIDKLKFVAGRVRPAVKRGVIQGLGVVGKPACKTLDFPGPMGVLIFIGGLGSATYGLASVILATDGWGAVSGGLTVGMGAMTMVLGCVCASLGISQRNKNDYQK